MNVFKFIFNSNTMCGIEAFCVIKATANVCFSCKFVNMKIHESSSLTIDDLTLNDVLSLRLASNCCEDIQSTITEHSSCCNANITSNCVLLHTPQTLVVFSRSKCIQFSDDLFRFCLEGTHDHITMLSCTIYYTLQSVILVSENEYYFLQCRDQMLYDSNGCLWADKTVKVESVYQVMLLYNLDKRNISKQNFKFNVHSTNFYSYLPELDIITPSAELDTMSKCVSLDSICRILDADAWMNCNEIDIFMQTLMSEDKNIHVTGCAWYSQKLLKNYADINSIQAVICCRETSNVFWFDKGFVVIPINVNACHWIVVVLDMSAHIIFYCDSMGKACREVIISQIYRYLNLEYFYKFGDAMKTNEWVVCNYCSSTSFPRQSDSSSCGPYICVMAKAITRHQILPKITNISSILRKYVVYEIMKHNKTLNILQSENNENSFECGEIEDYMLIADDIRKTLSSSQLLCFTRIPYGPLRFYIPKSIVEMLSTKEDNENLLNAFLVNDHEDDRILRNLIPPFSNNLIIYKFLDKMHDISRVVTERHLNDLAKLDPNVANCLIDHSDLIEIMCSKISRYC
jgi:hypothetical protein